MTTGEGGIVTTHDEETWRSLVSLRNQGRADGGGWLDHARLGFNYRIDDIRAALGIGQVEKLDTILSLRQAAAARYGELLAGVDGLEVPLADDADHVRSWFVYVVTLARGTDRERVIAELERAGDRVVPLPAVDPPPGLHARALRLPRGALPRLGGPVAADAGAPVLHGDRAAGPGAGRRGARRRSR